MRETLTSGLKLVVFVVFLPVFMTYCHLCYTFQRHGIILVQSLPSPQAPLASFQELPSGIYWSHWPPMGRSGSGSSYTRQEENSPLHRRKLFGFLPAWPSISQFAASLVQRETATTAAQSCTLDYSQKYQSYCFFAKEYTLCPVKDESKNSNDGEALLFPPAYASWKVVEKQGKAYTSPTEKPATIPLRIQSFSFFKPFYFQHEEKLLQQMFQIPATGLLLACNIGLAFLYWNYRVNPDAVSLTDTPMLQQYQYWRGITGTFAHFHWWHLLFNMMSLHNLGQFLEEHYYGSINFLLYNLGLVPLTVIIFFGGAQLVYLYRVRASNNGTSNGGAGMLSLSATTVRPSINAVGYSGVLFAWMVVASLEQTKSCPVPFWDDLCFDTWHLTRHIKFNVGPLIQLVIAQFLLPRASFGGHLSGIVAGFMLHWNLIPLEVVQPFVSIPLITLAQWQVRQLLPKELSGGQNTMSNLYGNSSPRNFLDEAGIDDDDMDNNNNQSSRGATPSSLSKLPFIPCQLGLHGHQGGTGMSQLLGILFQAMLILFACSIAILSWGSSLLYSQATLLALHYVCYQFYSEHWFGEGGDHWSPETTQKKQRMLILWRGFITSCVLVLILESMTLASWILIGSAFFSPLACSLAFSLLCALLLVHLMALSLACNHWEEVGGAIEDKGIFEYVFGYCVLDNAKVVGHAILASWMNVKGCGHNHDSRIGGGGNRVGNGSSGGIVLSSPRRGGSKTAGDRDSAKSLAAAAAERRARESSR